MIHSGPRARSLSANHRRGAALSALGPGLPDAGKRPRVIPALPPDRRVASGDLFKCFLSSLCIDRVRTGGSPWHTARSQCGWLPAGGAATSTSQKSDWSQGGPTCDFFFFFPQNL